MLNELRNLKCPKCEGELFTPLFNIIWGENRGCATRPAGYKCQGCDKVVDQGSMILALKREDNTRKIKELEAQLEH